MNDDKRVAIMAEAGPIAQKLQEIKARIGEPYEGAQLVLIRSGAEPLVIGFPVSDDPFHVLLWNEFAPLLLQIVDEYQKALSAQMDVLSEQFYETI